jgi:hypothetical protein
MAIYLTVHVKKYTVKGYEFYLLRADNWEKTARIGNNQINIGCDKEFQVLEYVG